MPLLADAGDGGLAAARTAPATPPNSSPASKPKSTRARCSSANTSAVDTVRDHRCDPPYQRIHHVREEHGQHEDEDRVAYRVDEIQRQNRHSYGEQHQVEDAVMASEIEAPLG